MKYNLANDKEAGAATRYLAELTLAGNIAEVKKISPKRSLNQNAYLHLILSAFGNHFGYPLEEAKQVYKELNHHIYKYERTVRGRTWVFWRSSAALTKTEMAASIDVLHEWSAKAGYPLPLATDQEWLRQIDNELQSTNYHLKGSTDV